MSEPGPDLTTPYVLMVRAVGMLRNGATAGQWEAWAAEAEQFTKDLER